MRTRHPVNNALNRLGFSLIELMVVIAIIGIISAIVMTSLNSARGGAANKTIKANLNTARSQSIIYFDSNNFTFGTQPRVGCAFNLFSDISGNTNIQSIVLSNNAIANGTYCSSNQSAWVMRSPLKVPEGNFTWWCVDHTGVSKGVTAVQVSNWVNSNYVCP